MITSANNQQVKNVIQLNQRAKARREQGLFAAEGRKMFLEAPRSWIHQVFVSESLAGDQELMSRMAGLPAEVVADPVFGKMCDTQTPQGILTVLRKPSYTMEALLKKKNPLLVILEDLQDPGNAGTIFRTGEGAGVSGVFLTKNSVDITNPKVIRATMGSIYRMPFLYVENVVYLKQELERRGIRTFAAHLLGKKDYDQEDYLGGSAFFIGNEGNGLTQEAAEAADCLVRIPMEGEVESLNAAMAAGILMYEAARQRRSRLLGAGTADRL
ncbi:MAG: RNA methyltransferase [Eubacteriales bacterium]|nr:RNA methyltransferase [Eubacteriales bacterium]